MKKYLFLLLFAITSTLFAEPATKEDVNMILKVMEAHKKDLENQIKAVKSDLENQIKATKSDLENQIKSSNQRIDDINGYMLALIGGIFVTVGFIWWDRRTMIAQAKKEVQETLEPKFEKMAERKTLNELLQALQEWSHDKPDLQEVLKRHHLAS